MRLRGIWRGFLDNFTGKNNFAGKIHWVYHCQACRKRLATAKARQGSATVFRDRLFRFLLAPHLQCDVQFLVLYLPGQACRERRES